MDAKKRQLPDEERDSIDVNRDLKRQRWQPIKAVFPHLAEEKIVDALRRAKEMGKEANDKEKKEVEEAAKEMVSSYGMSLEEAITALRRSKEGGDLSARKEVALDFWLNHRNFQEGGEKDREGKDEAKEGEEDEEVYSRAIDILWREESVNEAEDASLALAMHLLNESETTQSVAKTSTVTLPPKPSYTKMNQEDPLGSTAEEEDASFALAMQLQEEEEAAGKNRGGSDLRDERKGDKQGSIVPLPYGVILFKGCLNQDEQIGVYKLVSDTSAAQKQGFATLRQLQRGHSWRSSPHPATFLSYGWAGNLPTYYYCYLDVDPT